MIFAQNLVDYLQDPSFRSKYKKLFFLSDSCGAGTLFHKIDNIKDAYFIGSSGWDQNSSSLDYDEIYSQPLNDRFSFRLKELLQENLGSKTHKLSWNYIQNSFNFTYLESDLLEYNFMDKPTDRIYMNDFLEQNENREVVRIDFVDVRKKYESVINELF